MTKKPARNQGGSPDHSPAVARLVRSGPSRWGIAIAVFAVIAVHLLTGVDGAAFHGDEAWWSSAGYYYSGLMFVAHDYSPASWSRKGYWEWGLLSPPAGKYVIGLAMRAALPAGEYYYPYDFGKTEQENRARGTIPPPEVLRPGRTASAIASLIACAIVFLICLSAWDWVVGLAAAVFLAFNGVFSLFAQRAMTDAPLILFLALGVLCCVGLVRTAQSNRPFFLLLCAAGGIAAGVAASVKFNGVVALACVEMTVLYVALVVRPRKPARIAAFLAGGILAAAVAGGTAILLNPMYYTTSPGELIARVTMVLDNWDILIVTQQHGNPAQSITGFPGMAIEHLMVTYYSPILSVLALVGLVRWLSLGIGGAFTRGASAPFVAGASCLLVLVLVLAWIPLDWDRYYLPMVVALVPFSAYGICTVADAVYRRVI
jgi:hypothetical protein